MIYSFYRTAWNSQEEKLLYVGHTFFVRICHLEVLHFGKQCLLFTLQFRFVKYLSSTTRKASWAYNSLIAKGRFFSETF